MSTANLSTHFSNTAAALQDRIGHNWRAIGIVFVLACIVFVSKFKRKGKLPPGPPGWPILGNLLDLNDRSWLKFTEWKKTYGQFYVSLFV